MEDGVKNSLSIVILAKNEAKMIGECIDSFKPLRPTEVLVVDDASTDDTTSIAVFKGATVMTYPKKDFAQAREFGMKKTKGDWVLYIDADERMTPALAQEIQQVLIQPDPTIGAYSIVRVNHYLGKKWPQTESIVRLVNRAHFQKWQGEVHETLIYSGQTGKLTAPLLHFTHQTLEDMVTHTIMWSAVEAKLRFQANHPPIVWWRIPRVMLPVFVEYYFRQGGWRLGTVGLIESIYQAFSIFVTYARLWELQQQNNQL